MVKKRIKNMGTKRKRMISKQMVKDRMMSVRTIRKRMMNKGKTKQKTSKCGR